MQINVIVTHLVSSNSSSGLLWIHFLRPLQPLSKENNQTECAHSLIITSFREIIDSKLESLVIDIWEIEEGEARIKLKEFWFEYFQLQLSWFLVIDHMLVIIGLWIFWNESAEMFFLEWIWRRKIWVLIIRGREYKKSLKFVAEY